MPSPCLNGRLERSQWAHSGARTAFHSFLNAQTKCADIATPVKCFMSIVGATPAALVELTYLALARADCATLAGEVWHGEFNQVPPSNACKKVKPRALTSWHRFASSSVCRATLHSQTRQYRHHIGPRSCSSQFILRPATTCC